jgi:hypothetical protein
MDPDVLTFAQVSAVIVGLVGSLSLIGVVAYKAIVWKQRAPRARVDDDRLERLQQSVDAIAIEVERIAEAQRFMAKLLTEHPERASLPR